MRNKKTKRLTPDEAAAIRALTPGDEVEIILPKSAYSRRETYRTIGALAHYYFGAGQYRMHVEHGDITCRIWRDA